MEKLNSNVKQVYQILESVYGYQGWWPLKGRTDSYDRDSNGYRLFPDKEKCEPVYSPEDRLEIAIGAVLTQNTTWRNAEKAINNLFEKQLMDARKILETATGELAQIIRPSGYYNQKAIKLKGLTEFLYKGDFLSADRIPSRDDLLNVWGIGEETADSILLYAYNQLWFVTDAYTKRIFSRLGFLSGNEKYKLIQEFFHRNMPEDSFIYSEYHALIVKHAVTRCLKNNPKCSNCFLSFLCRMP